VVGSGKLLFADAGRRPTLKLIEAKAFKTGIVAFISQST
jgi:hypothetical protein